MQIEKLDKHLQVTHHEHMMSSIGRLESRRFLKQAC